MRARRRCRVSFLVAALLLTAVVFTAGCGPYTFLQEIAAAVGSGAQDSYDQVLNDQKHRYETYAQPDNSYRINEETLQVTYDAGSSWIAVPVSLDKLFDAGMVKKSLPRGRAYISPETTAFIYGDSANDTWIVVSSDMGVSWQKNRLAQGQPGFIGFTADGFGYCSIAVDAACGSLYFTMYVSEDYGRTWKERPLENGMNVMDCFFLSDQIGFYTTRSSQEPSLYRTQDGGVTWLSVSLPVIDYCTMAYGPEWQDGVLVLYANEDGYAPMEGEMVKYTSEDDGVSWEAAGKVRRQETSG